MKTPHSEQGFTLIELLTVIAIIGVLAGLLIPVVGKVRKSAARSATTSNLREIHKAILLYANDHKDRLPGPCGNGILFRTRIPAQPADTAHLGAFLAPYLTTTPADSNQWVDIPVLKCPALSSEAQSNPLIANFVKLDDAVTHEDNTWGTSVLTMSAVNNPGNRLPRRLGEITAAMQGKAIVTTSDQVSWSAAYGDILPAGPVFDGKRLYLFLSGKVTLSSKGRAGN